MFGALFPHERFVRALLSFAKQEHGEELRGRHVTGDRGTVQTVGLPAFATRAACAAPGRDAANNRESPVVADPGGCHIPDPQRYGPATLVQAGGQNLLFDAGRGVTTRLYQLHIPLREVNPVFITHYHSDHINGLPDLWLSGWLGAPWAKRIIPMQVIGPKGLRELTDNLAKAYAADIRIRMADEHYPLSDVTFQPEEFDKNGIIFEKEGVKVTAFEVDHGDVIKPPYGYRVDYNGHSVLISGDTRPTENVVKYGTNVDLLIHEVCAARPEITDPQAKAVMAHHTSPQQAGTVFARANPKMAAFTHVVMISRPKVPAPSIDEVVSQARQSYAGPLVAGTDLMGFEIGANGVVVTRDH